MKLDINTKQAMTLSPRIIQSIEILQMGNDELLEYIESLAQENPVIELEHGFEYEFSLFKRKLNWFEAADIQNLSYYISDTEEQAGDSPRAGINDDEDLRDFVRTQLHMLKLDKEVLAAAEYVVESLDGRGYFNEDETELAKAAGINSEVLSEAVSAVQTLEPAGVGARSLQECLLLQLKRRNIADHVVESIISGYLNELGRGCYNHIAEKLGIKIRDVSKALELIRSLNPYPGSGYSAGEAPAFINPDVIIKKNGDKLEAAVNETYLPEIRISGFYRELFQDSTEKELREYLGGKIKQAKWVIKSIQQREATVLGCARCILEIQEDFFRLGPAHLKPMSLEDVADRMNVHVSTVSRALRNKYVQCAGGVFPMSYFFSRALSGIMRGAVPSPEQARQMLKSIIDKENKAKPLSDREISGIIEREGVCLSRRTVAKYREELGIPSTMGRKLRT
ncbi:MAG: RNA polymerase factor sigma-54 [Oscillospiraceae bacterium]